jgi:hypothetical protein
LIAAAALVLAGGTAPPHRWNSADPDRPFQIGALSVRCDRDGNLHGYYVEGCSARMVVIGVDVSIARSPDAVSVWTEVKGCNAMANTELPAAKVAKGVASRAGVLKSAVEATLEKKRKACGMAVAHDFRTLKSSDLQRFLDQSDDLQDFRDDKER